MTMRLTVEQAAWMDRMLPKKPDKPKAAKAERPVPEPVLSDAEIAWLWPFFQKCSVQSYSFARSFQKTALEKLTPRGKAVVHSVAYKYRRQIFKDSAKWTESEFVGAVRAATLKQQN